MVLPPAVRQRFQFKNINDVVNIACGCEHSLAVRSDGKLWSWGLGISGQLGTGKNDSSDIPVEVQQLTNVTSIEGGFFHSLAIENSQLPTLSAVNPVSGIAGENNLSIVLASVRIWLALKLPGSALEME